MVWLTEVNQCKRRELEPVKPADTLEPKWSAVKGRGSRFPCRRCCTVGVELEPNPLG